MVKIIAYNFQFLIIFLENTEWFIGAKNILSNPNVPIIFKSIRGDCIKPRNGTSFYNKAEQNVLMDYVDKLLSGKWKNREVCCRDIGIISPYRAQCDQIYAACCAKGFRFVKRPICVCSIWNQLLDSMICNK